MKILMETVEDVEFLIEGAESGKKSYFIKGVFVEANVKNRNGRVYPLAVMEREVERYTKEFINTKRALGELNHPPGVQVDPERASHLIMELSQDKNQFIGKAKVLDTPCGKVVKALLDEGVQLGVSSRALGSIKESNGAKIVQNDFKLMTVDIVSDPSCSAAFVESIMENKEYYFENGILKEKDYETIQKTVKNMSKTKISEGALLDMFDQFIKSLK